MSDCAVRCLPVNKRVEQIILCNVFKIYNGSSPKYLNEQFKPQNSLHNYETRSSLKGGFVLPRIKSYGSKSNLPLYVMTLTLRNHNGNECLSLVCVIPGAGVHYMVLVFMSVSF